MDPTPEQLALDVDAATERLEDVLSQVVKATREVEKAERAAGIEAHNPHLPRFGWPHIKVCVEHFEKLALRQGYEAGIALGVVLLKLETGDISDAKRLAMISELRSGLD